MKHLIIETSTERGLIALYDNEDCLFHHDLPFGHNNSTHLIPMIADGFKSCGLAPKDLSLVSVGIGPGSYTGIRVGVIVAKTLALACNLPLIGVSSLHGFTHPNEGPFAVVIDAKIGGVYLLIGERKVDDIHYHGIPEVCELASLATRLNGIKQLVTPYAANLKKKFDQLFPDENWHLVESSPDPLKLKQVAQEKYVKKEYDPEGYIDILYLRKTQAEIERQAKQAL